MASEVGQRRVAVVTGTRAEFGLLRPVMRAIEARNDLELMVIAAGAHLIMPAVTYHEVKAEFAVADSIPMQTAGKVGRWADVESLGKGIGRFGRSFDRLRPDVVLVLGDRIEAFAAASAASIGGLPVAHIHGGDLAEGVADEAMRHAITKLSHIHFPATASSAARIRQMGEPEQRIHVVGSPAIDGLDRIPEMNDEQALRLGDPEAVMLMHPVGRPDEQEEAVASAAIEAIGDRRLLCLMPNLDPGRNGIVRAIEAQRNKPNITIEAHLPREAFVGLLKRLAGRGGVLVGNSSAGIIECSAIGARVVNIGPRQAGRERAGHVVDAAGESAGAIAEAIERAQGMTLPDSDHPFGDGHAGERIAEVIAGVNLAEPGFGHKRWAEIG
ncbi:MAG TPA: UDP-N-acetylglucosamine 2-epimerase (hydrolyzing) [Phycisphaerales bacterium]|nr:UDP-N-acetylglucosamine 2-epimerase (hydrolyzing) [Phycisphaerales bacterium]